MAHAFERGASPDINQDASRLLSDYFLMSRRVCRGMCDPSSHDVLQLRTSSFRLFLAPHLTPTLGHAGAQRRFASRGRIQKHTFDCWYVACSWLLVAVPNAGLFRSSPPHPRSITSSPTVEVLRRMALAHAALRGADAARVPDAIIAIWLYEESMVQQPHGPKGRPLRGAARSHVHVSKSKFSRVSHPPGLAHRL